MAPRSISNWRRPYTSIYNDNVRYGTGLYSDTLSDIEKRYSESLSRTQLRSDRPDLAFTSFSGSNLTSSPTPVGDSGPPIVTRQVSSSPMKEFMAGASPSFESRLGSALHSSYALDEDVQDAIRSRKERKKQQAATRSSEETSKQKFLYEDATFFMPPKAGGITSPELDTDAPRSSRRKIGGGHSPTNGPTSSAWREKCRELQEQMESLERAMTESNNKLKNDLTSLKGKYHAEINDLSGSIDNSSQQASELQKVCKRQANQLLELQSAFDDVQRNLQDTLEEMNIWQTKCKALKNQMDRIREDVEQAVLKSIKRE